MAKKSLFDNIVGTVKSKIKKEPPKKESSVQVEVEDEVDHLWMTQDNSQIINKPATKKDPRIETGILKDRIREKIGKIKSDPS